MRVSKTLDRGSIPRAPARILITAENEPEMEVRPHKIFPNHHSIIVDNHVEKATLQATFESAKGFLDRRKQAQVDCIRSPYPQKINLTKRQLVRYASKLIELEHTQEEYGLDMPTVLQTKEAVMPFVLDIVTEDILSTPPK